MRSKKKAIVGLALLVTLAALCVGILSLLQMRRGGSEHPAIGDIRTVISAQEAYASMNGGFYDRPDCLATPSTCLPGYPPSSPTFIDPVTASLATKNGYARRFHPGPKAPPEAIAKAKASPSSILSFAYVAVPASPAEQSRSFCGDSNHVVCFTPIGETMPPITDGHCPERCTPF